MTLIDANAPRVPEGDYLAMCAAMKEVYGLVKSARQPAGSRSLEYHELEEELARTEAELARLHRERDAIRYARRMTRAMKREAIGEYAFTEGLHSLREHTCAALEEAGLRVDLHRVYGRFMDAFNADVFQRRGAVQRLVEETRAYRDAVVRDLAAVLEEV